MLAENTEAECQFRMAKIQEIAKGIFDMAERRAVLDLVRDYEKLVLAKERYAEQRAF